MIATLSKLDPDSELVTQDDEFRWWKVLDAEECFWSESERKAFSIDDEDVDQAYVRAVNVVWGL